MEVDITAFRVYALEQSMHHRSHRLQAHGWEAMIPHEWEGSKVGSHWLFGFLDF